MQDHVFIERLWSWSTPEQFFLFWGSVPEIYGPFLLVISVVALTSLVPCGLCYAVLRLGFDAGMQREAAFWMVVAVGSFFMMTLPSQPLWSLLSPLQTVQFPFRFNTVLIVALIPLVAGALAADRSVELPFQRAMAMLGVLLVASWSVPTTFYVAKAARGLPSPERRRLPRRLLERREYHPRTAGLVVEAYAADRPVEPRPPVRLLAGEGEVRVEVWRARRIEHAVALAQPGEIELGQLYYPGWQAETLDDPGDVVLQPTPDEGLLGLHLPAGRYRLVVKVHSSAERVGAGISLAALALLLALPAARVFGRRRAGLVVDLQAVDGRR